MCQVSQESVSLSQIACFIAAGTAPDCSEVLKMSVMMEASVSMLSFSKVVGIGSSSRNFGEDCTMIRLLSPADATWNSHVHVDK